MTEDIALSENSQSLCLKRAADDGIGSTDLSERAERVVSPRLTARSERQTWSLKGFSRPGHGNYGQFSYVQPLQVGTSDTTQLDCGVAINTAGFGCDAESSMLGFTVMANSLN
ncbi:hypothetical protein P5673_025802 [Acropora cervicornis]|uniref:Uncharacterized protein n=1 Tax=Acropora cervicornis TaxID=6130 RepID=A0AAD9UWT7_ACRCE|nr:hypothetical protein P5673_025802 [Acropora cervicornis]